MPVQAPDMRWKLSPDTKMLAYALGAIPLSMLAGAVAHQVARQGMLDEVPASPKKVERFVKRHLGPNVVLRPEPGLGNAGYAQEKDEQGNVIHVISYDPRSKMSVIAHEIGHADWQLPHSHALDVISPALLAFGTYQAGKHLGRGRPIGQLPLASGLAGAGLYAPTLINEILASRRARELVDDPSGLGAGLATYAVPPLWAGLEGLGAYALARHLYKNGCAHAKLEQVKQLIIRAAKSRPAFQAGPTVQ